MFSDVGSLLACHLSFTLFLVFNLKNVCRTRLKDGIRLDNIVPDTLPVPPVPVPEAQINATGQ
jgi:hypothetical protein